jgi:hypothetical protein
VTKTSGRHQHAAFVDDQIVSVSHHGNDWNILSGSIAVASAIIFA